jgi:hypothetical protein
MEHDKAKLLSLCDNLFVLIAATIQHDSALGRGGRKGHGARLLDNSYFMQLSQALLQHGIKPHDSEFLADNILFVAAAHSCNDTFMQCSTSTDVQHTFHDGKTISLTLGSLAGLLRLCDELSDNRQRVSLDTDGNIPDYVIDSSKVFWEHSLCIATSTIKFEHGKGAFVRIEYNLPTEKKDNVYQIIDENNVIQRITLYTFIVNRIRKVRAEMSMCCMTFSSIAPMNNLEIVLKYTTNRREVHKKNPTYPCLPNAPQGKYWDDICGTKENEDLKF